MKHFTLTIASLLCFGLAMSDADAARRFGGGTSSGMKRDNVMQRQAAPPAAAPAQQAQPATPAPQPASGMSKWLGPLAGLALGAGLASMFMGGGGMGGIAMVLLLALAAFFVFRVRRRPESATAPMQYAGAMRDGLAPVLGAPARFDALAPAASPVDGNGGHAAAWAPSLPTGFDADAFLRQAKLNFIRLQAANDRKDLTDIRNFTTPEMFAEISLQAQERGADPQQVDVTELNAEILDVTEGADEHLASVRFHGALRDGPQAVPESFDEVWHLAKPADGKSGWLIAGIQQTS